MKLYSEYTKHLSLRIHNHSYSKMKEILKKCDHYTVTSLLREAIQKHIDKVYKNECK